jgi:group I intron endonuclease
MYIYKITNKLNGKIYVGLSKFTPEENIEYLGSGYLIKKAVECYGRDNFIKTILEECDSKELLLERERYWIATLKANDRNVGYNICEGGTWGDNWENHPRKDELRKHLKLIFIGKGNPNYGNRWTPEQKLKASIRMKANRPFIDKETGENIAKRLDIRKKISDTKLGLYNPNANLWKLVSPINETYMIEGGIKRGLKRYNLEYQAFQKNGKIQEDGSLLNKRGWKLYKLPKPI